MTYKNGNNILNDYYGVALSILNLDSHDALVYSENLERLYEIAYLLILSRTGKLMDSNGFHKIHAFGLAFEDMAYIAMMPSKGGKTTLFLDLISSNKNFEMISDDTPVCDMRGNIYSFPLRIGVEPTHNIPDDLLKHSYTIDRLQYGKKILIPLNVFPNLFSRIKSKSTIFTCRRIYDKSCRIEKSSTLATFKDLQKHMVIGIGLPMILEYFLESNLLDFFRLSFIFLRRLISSLVLSIKSKNYIVYLGTDLELNYSTMEDFIKEKK